MYRKAELVRRKRLGLGFGRHYSRADRCWRVCWLRGLGYLNRANWLRRYDRLDDFNTLGGDYGRSNNRLRRFHKPGRPRRSWYFLLNRG
jgi:hypothetical protein